MTSTDEISTAQVVRLPRPVWAQLTRIIDDVDNASVIHEAASQLIGRMYIGNDDEPTPCVVEVTQTDDLRAAGCQVLYERGNAHIFLTEIDASFRSTTEARVFAAAIVECCDRLDGAK